jgi:site-specific recombinase XerD
VIFDQAANRMETDDPAAAAAAASRLRQATPHWMRHTGVTHAMESGASPRYVQAQARHSSLNVTAKYDHQVRRAWRADLERM